MPPDQVVNGGMKMRTRMLHKYLNPIDTEVTQGGLSSRHGCWPAAAYAGTSI